MFMCVCFTYIRVLRSFVRVSIFPIWVNRPLCVHVLRLYVRVYTCVRVSVFCYEVADDCIWGDQRLCVRFYRVCACLRSCVHVCVCSCVRLCVFFFSSYAFACVLLISVRVSRVCFLYIEGIDKFQEILNKDRFLNYKFKNYEIIWIHS